MARFVLACALLLVVVALSEASHRDAEQGSLQHHRNETKQYQLILNGDKKNGLESLNLVCSNKEVASDDSFDRKPVYKSNDFINNQNSVSINLVQLVEKHVTSAPDNAKRDSQEQ